jgi:hypothetical protein
MEQDAIRFSLREMGIPVVRWDGEQPLDLVLRMLLGWLPRPANELMLSMPARLWAEFHDAMRLPPWEEIATAARPVTAPAPGPARPEMIMVTALFTALSGGQRRSHHGR